MGNKRKPNVSLIQTSRSYTIREVAERLDRQVETVRTWVQEGLPVLPGTTPRLIDGAELKEWLKARQA
ncbi:MAG TPA: DNA-binding protein, partial [Hyphomonas sp.]|nr:DNA-binding protein [Hyphomonas sp.]